MRGEKRKRTSRETCFKLQHIITTLETFQKVFIFKFFIIFGKTIILLPFYFVVLMHLF